MAVSGCELPTGQTKGNTTKRKYMGPLRNTLVFSYTGYTHHNGQRDQQSSN